MNPFSKRIHQIKNPDLDLPKGTRNPFLDVKSVFGFTERNTPLMFFNYLTVVFQIGNPKLILQKFPSLGKFLGQLFDNSVILLSGKI